jgi:UDPglucose 6-dehydrogenase
MKITFINEIADLCEQIGADVQKVAKGIGYDKRIGDKFLHAGPGYGGSCFPKDTLALVKTASDADSPMRLIETTVAINDNRKRAMARKVITACGGSVRGKKIAVLGLTFKPNTDDLRDAPALTIIQALQDHGATISAFDPEGMDGARALLNDVEFGPDPYAIAAGAEAIVLVTEWDEFRALDFRKLHATMKAPNMIDLRNVYPPQEARRYGFEYVGIGRSGDRT